MMDKLQFLLGILDRCVFIKKTFAPAPCLRSKTPNEAGYFANVPFRGQAFDDSKEVIIENGWDHSHCFICSASIDVGDRYWNNQGDDDIDLCEKCHELVLADATNQSPIG